MEEIDLPIPSPLLECFKHCEVDCVRECCGINALSTDPAVIGLWARAAGPAPAAEALRQLDTLIGVAQDRTKIVSSAFLNHVTEGDDDARAKLLDFLAAFRTGLALTVNRPDTLASIEPLLQCSAYALGHLRIQVADVTEPNMAAQPVAAAEPPGGTGSSVIPNHPAWTIGHLVFTCQLLGAVADLAPWLPDHWAARYGPGSKPVTDAHAYESKSQLLAALDDAESRLTRAIRDFDPARLDDPFPDPGYRHVFPTIRRAFTQVLVGHTAYHVGQITVWRRAMGMWPLNRPFE